MKPEVRRNLARLPFEEKIRKVGELIRLSRNVKASSADALEEQPHRAGAEFDVGKGVPIAQVSEDIRDCAKAPKNGSEQGRGDIGGQAREGESVGNA